MIDVAEYDPEWVTTFEALRDRYARALAAAGVPYVSIEHVGSTAVPGLAAKPIIDIDIVVAVEQVAAASAVLIELGFRPLGELGIPERWAFATPPDLRATATYVIVDGCLSLRNHLAVRDTLRRDPELRDRYAAVKRDIAATGIADDPHGEGKMHIIAEILTRAGITEEERDSIASNVVPSFDEVPRQHDPPHGTT